MRVVCLALLVTSCGPVMVDPMMALPLLVLAVGVISMAPPWRRIFKEWRGIEYHGPLQPPKPPDNPHEHCKPKVLTSAFEPTKVRMG